MGAIVYVALGSNLDGPVEHIRRAIADLDLSPQIHLGSVSRLYRSAPLGSPTQPDYINAVVKLETELSPEMLLNLLQAIERAHGRVHTGERWDSRPLDLDILLYDDGQIHTADLQIPHPRMVERAFVLYPLHEITPSLEIPGCGPLSDLLHNCPSKGLELLDD